MHVLRFKRCVSMQMVEYCMQTPGKWCDADRRDLERLCLEAAICQCFSGLQGFLKCSGIFIVPAEGIVYDHEGQAFRFSWDLSKEGAALEGEIKNKHQGIMLHMHMKRNRTKLSHIYIGIASECAQLGAMLSWTWHCIVHCPACTRVGMLTRGLYTRGLCAAFLLRARAWL